MSVSNWLVPNTIIALASLAIAAFSLGITFFINRRLFKQNAQFKSADLTREEMYEIRKTAADFLSAHAERLLFSDDMSNLSKNLASIEKKAQIGGNADEKSTLISELMALRKLHHSAYANQAIAYETMKLLLGDNPKFGEVEAAMDALMDAQSLSEQSPSVLTNTVNGVLSSKSNNLQQMIGIQP